MSDQATSNSKTQEFGEDNWIDAMAQKPPPLTPVLVRCKKQKLPLKAYWIPANTVAVEVEVEGWYTGEYGKDIIPLSHRVISWSKQCTTSK